MTRGRNRRLWLVRVLALVGLAGAWGFACGGPQKLGGPGSICFRPDDCQAGLECVPEQTGADKHVCSADLSGIVSMVDGAAPDAATGGGAVGGGPAAAGASAAAGATAAAGANAAGGARATGGASGTAGAAGKTSTAGAGGHSGAANNGGSGAMAGAPPGGGAGTAGAELGGGGTGGSI